MLKITFKLYVRWFCRKENSIWTTGKILWYFVTTCRSHMSHSGLDCDLNMPQVLCYYQIIRVKYFESCFMFLAFDCAQFAWDNLLHHNNNIYYAHLYIICTFLCEVISCVSFASLRKCRWIFLHILNKAWWNNKRVYVVIVATNVKDQFLNNIT